MRRVVHRCGQNGANRRRVCQSSSDAPDGYSWDASGNPLFASRGAQAHSYGVNGLNQLNYRSIFGVGTSHLSFDSNGCLVQSAPNYPYDPIDTWNYTYDAKSRLTSASRRAYGATDFALVVSNRYDHLDRRVQKITPATTSSSSTPNSSTPNSSTRQLYVPFYDANGNVMGWLSGIPDS